MSETEVVRPSVGESGSGELASVGRLIERAEELLSAVRDMAEVAGDLLPNTTDEDKVRAVLHGQMALCDSIFGLLRAVAAPMQSAAQSQGMAAL